MNVRPQPQQHQIRPLLISASCLLLLSRSMSNISAQDPTPTAHPAQTVQWESIGPGGGGSLQELAVHPQDPDCILVSCDMGTVWRSLDGGRRFESLHSRIAGADNLHHGNVFVRDWAWSLSNPPVLYGCDWGVLRSPDHGNSWSYAPLLDNRRARRIAVDPRNPDRIIVGLHQLGRGQSTLLLSEQAGENLSNCGQLTGGGWIQSPVEGLAFDPKAPDRVVANTHSGLFTSTDGGRHWAKTMDGFGCGEIETSEQYGQTNFVTSIIRGDRTGPKSAGSILRSTDGGRTWIDITGGLDRFRDRRQGSPKPVYFAVHPTNPDIIYAGSGLRAPKGLFVTRDGGRRWNEVQTRDLRTRGYLNAPPLSWPFWANDIDLCTAHPEVIYWGDNGLFRSNDGLNSDLSAVYTDETTKGHFRGRGLEPTGSGIVAFHPTNENILYAGWIDLGFLTSHDRGQSWSIQKSTEIGHSFAPVIDPANPEQLWLTTYSGGAEPSPVHVLQSDNAGNSWSDLNRFGLPEIIAQKAVRQHLLLEPASPTDRRTLYLALQSHQNYGANDKENAIGFYVFDGTTWTKRNQGLPLRAPHLGAMAYAGPQHLWVGVNSFQQSEEGPFLCETTNAGQTWRTHLVRNEVQGYATAIVTDPQDPSRLFAAFSRNTYMFRQKGPGSGGLIRTDDGGRTWDRVFGPGSVEGVAIHPQNSSIMVLGVRSLWNQPGQDMPPGLYLSQDGGDNWAPLEGHLPDAEFRWLAFSPHTPHPLYVSTFGGGLFRGVLP